MINSYLKKAKNGLQCGFLSRPSGISTLGAAFKIGAQDAEKSGQTFLTFQSKLFDAIKSPSNAFNYGITPKLQVFNDHTVMTLQFLPECAPQARDIFCKFLSDEFPSHQSIIRSRYEMSNLESFGILKRQDILLSMVQSASYGGNPISIYSTDGIFELNPSKDIISSIQSRMVPIASSDMESTMLDIAGSLKNISSKFDSIHKRPINSFKAGQITRESSGVKLSGSRLLKLTDLPYAAISFPAPSATSPDFLKYKVFEKVLGGGSQFSSEGYGSGISSILYTHLLSRYPIEEIQAKYIPGLNNGLITIWFHGDSKSFQSISKRVKLCMKMLSQKSSKSEYFEAGKNQAILEYLKAIDGSDNLFADFGSNLIIYGKQRKSKDIIESIDKITKEQVMKCAQTILNSKPSAVLLGKGDVKSLLVPWK